MTIRNPRWGYTRIRGALGNIGYEIGRTTIKRILSEHGIEPAPERGKRTPWRTFLKAHWGAIAAMDFLTVEAVTFTGLVRYFVLIVIDLETRRVDIAGIVHQPDGRWMAQVARNLTDVASGFLRDSCYVIHDRDPLYTTQFRSILEAAGVTPIRLPAKSPNLNAYAERFVRSIKEECLSRVVPLGEAHLRDVVREYMVHYHEERNHQGLANELITPPAKVTTFAPPIQRRERVGGVLNYPARCDPAPATAAAAFSMHADLPASTTRGRAGWRPRDAGQVADACSAASHLPGTARHARCSRQRRRARHHSGYRVSGRVMRVRHPGHYDILGHRSGGAR